MSEELVDKQVICRRCRYRFTIQIPDAANWRFDAHCPSCEAWEHFTEADTRDLPPASQAEPNQQVQGLGELLWRPIQENHDHPAIGWFDRVGNGLFEDDYSGISWPYPHPIYRFSRERFAAYIWQVEGIWFVRGWHPLRESGPPPEARAVASLTAALELLAAVTR